jgi:N-acetylmuramoyl-L-alanine amidase
VEFSPTGTGELAGMRIGLDPGHDIGNSSHLSQINAYYWVGLRKTCNTTGTATNAGYPESTYNFDVAARVRRLLNAHGATVVLTRDRNTRDTYGPCVGARGSLGKQEKVRFMVTVHADGGPSTGRGFHVIAPAYYKGYTDDIYTQSRTLATSMIAGLKAGGLTPTTYLSSALSVRKDVGSHNMSDVPIVTVETLNMRNSSDARIASTSSGRQKVAYAIYLGILRYARSL